MFTFLVRLQRGVEAWTRRFGVAVLQLALGLAYIWYGAMTFFGQSAMLPSLRIALRGMPFPLTFQVLGAWEIAIGVVIILPLLSISRRVENIVAGLAIMLVSVQLLAVIAAVLFSSLGFFAPRFPYLSVAGEVFLRMLVFAAAAMVVAGHLREYEEG